MEAIESVNVMESENAIELRNAIEVKGLWAAYEDRMIIEEMNLKIPKAEKNFFWGYSQGRRTKHPMLNWAFRQIR